MKPLIGITPSLKPDKTFGLLWVMTPTYVSCQLSARSKRLVERR